MACTPTWLEAVSSVRHLEGLFYVLVYLWHHSFINKKAIVIGVSSLFTVLNWDENITVYEIHFYEFLQINTHKKNIKIK